MTGDVLGIYSSNLDEFFRVRVAAFGTWSSCGKGSWKVNSTLIQAPAYQVQKVVTSNWRTGKVFAGILSDWPAKT
jgi:polyphosphate kinase